MALDEAFLPSDSFRQEATTEEDLDITEMIKTFYNILME